MAARMRIPGWFRFFSRPVVGLDIGASGVKMVELVRRGAAVTINWAAVADIPSRKKGGEERWRSQVVHAILSILKEKNARPERVYAALSSQSAVMRRMVTTDIPRRELAESVRWEFGETLPFPVESAVVDYRVLGEFKEKGAAKLELMAVAVERKTIDDLIALCREAGIGIAGVTVAPFALLDSLRAMPSVLPAEACLAADIGAELTTMAVISNGRLVFARSVPVAGNELTNSITGTLTSDAGQMTLDSGQAEKVKRAYGFPTEAQTQTPVDNMNLALAAAAMRPILEKLSREIKRSYDYVQRQNVTIGRLILTGGGSLLKNISLELSRETGIKSIGFVDADAATEAMAIDTGRLTERDLSLQMPRLMVALGAALGEEGGINLIAPGIRARRRTRLARTFWGYAGPLGIAVAIALVGITALRVRWYERRLVLLTRRYAQIQPALRRIADLEARHKRTSDMRGLYEQLHNGGIDGAHILFEVSRVVPAEITLLSIDARTEGRRKVMVVTGLVEGVDQAESLLARFMMSLDESRGFMNTRLISTKEPPGGPKSSLLFTISTTLE